jgi:hypothetical protein
MAKSKAHYYQLARAAENAAVRAVKDGTATPEQIKLAAEVDKRFRQQRLDRLSTETKGDQSQRRDRRDGIGIAPMVGAGNTENVGRIHTVSAVVKVDSSILTVTSYQLLEIGRSPYLRLIDASAKSTLLSLGSGSEISEKHCLLLESWLSSNSIKSLQKEWHVLIERADEYR